MIVLFNQAGWLNITYIKVTMGKHNKRGLNWMLVESDDQKNHQYVWIPPTCSCTSSKSELSISMKMGTAPAWITTRVWWDVPDAMLVNTHAASNYNNSQNIFIPQVRFKLQYDIHSWCRKSSWQTRAKRREAASSLSSLCTPAPLLRHPEEVYLQRAVFSPLQELNKALHHPCSGNDFIDGWVGLCERQYDKNENNNTYHSIILISMHLVF